MRELAVDLREELAAVGGVWACVMTPWGGDVARAQFDHLQASGHGWEVLSQAVDSCHDHVHALIVGHEPAAHEASAQPAQREE